MEAALVEIKEPQAKLIQQIINLERAAFGEAGLNEWTLPVLIEYGKVFVLEAGGEVCGTSGLMRHWSDPQVGYLVSFSIASERRGQGLGRDFLDKIVERLRKEGLTRIRLTVSPNNLSARSLYQSTGFKTVSFLPAYYGSGEDRLLMELRLDTER